MARQTLRAFWEHHPRAEAPLREWYALVGAAEWSGPEDLRAQFPSGIDFVADNRIVFNIRHNEYRLIAHVAYHYKRVLVKFVGTHKQYDRVNARTVR